jgi:hypothetical protein
MDPEPDELQFSALRNLISGRPVGHSQVTAVVQVDSQPLATGRLKYPVALRAELVAPYFIELGGPRVIRGNPHSDDCLSGQLALLPGHAPSRPSKLLLNAGPELVPLQCP